MVCVLGSLGNFQFLEMGPLATVSCVESEEDDGLLIFPRMRFESHG